MVNLLNPLRRTLVLLPVMAAVGLFTPAAHAERVMTDAVAAVVGDEIITVSDILEETLPTEGQLEKKYSKAELMRKVEALRRETANRLVETELVYAEFKEKEYKLPPEYFAKRVDSIVLAQAGGSRERFEKSLFERGMSWAEFEKKVQKMAAVDLLLDQAVRRAVHISPFLVKQYYDQHSSEMMLPGRIRVSVLQLKKDGVFSSDLDAGAKKIMGKLAEGATFASVVKDYSEGANAKNGGDLGWMVTTDVQKEIAEAVKDLKDGATAAPVKTSDGDVLIVQLTGREEAKAAAFNEGMARQIENKLRATEEEKRYKEFIETLSKKYLIKRFY